jgi:PhzF family phenazine biosynthesis protein
MNARKKQMSYRHVDVFSHAPFSGNGLTVFMNCDTLSSEMMQKITQEMRQFESIFLSLAEEPNRFYARIFTMEEELDFAGHPILGAACVLHEKILGQEKHGEWIFELRHKKVPVSTMKGEKSYLATMEQGKPEFLSPLERRTYPKILNALNLSKEDLYPHLPLQVISTGLPYLIVPVQCNLGKVRIVSQEFEQILAQVKAKFAYILNISLLEGRTWDNAGRVEDIATGSAAGPVGAYLIKHGIRQPETEIVVHQGTFVGRPSQMFVKVSGNADHIRSIKVSGEVCMVAKGTFDPF